MESFINRFWRAVDLLLALTMLAMILIVFSNVVLRYGFASGLRQSVEFSRLAFVWIVMIGAVVTLRRGGHLGMPEFAQKHFKGILPILHRVNWAIVLLCCVMLLWGSIRVTLSNWVNISPLTGLPLGLFFLSGVVAGVLMILIALKRLIHPESAPKPISGGDIA